MSTYEEKWEVLKSGIQSVLDGYVDNFSEEARLDGAVKAAIDSYLTVMQMMEVLEDEQITDEESEDYNPLERTFETRGKNGSVSRLE